MRTGFQTDLCHRVFFQGAALVTLTFSCELADFPSPFPTSLFPTLKRQYAILAPQYASHLVSLGVFLVVLMYLAMVWKE